jgi:sarcosine oxidase delta subunit
VAPIARSPDLLSEEEVRDYVLHLRDQRGVARGAFKTNGGILPWPEVGRDRVTGSVMAYRRGNAMILLGCVGVSADGQ